VGVAKRPEDLPSMVLRGSFAHSIPSFIFSGQPMEETRCQMRDQLEKLERQALDELSKAKTNAALEEIRIRFLGRRGKITLLLRSLADLPAQDRPAMGKMANRIKNTVTKALDEIRGSLASPAQGSMPSLDITLPGRRQWIGRLHPLTQVTREIVDIFATLGFQVARGPEVESEYYNFEALNFPKDHPARDMQDTYYLADDIVLRTHTSPVQIRVMEGQKPPVRVVMPGRVYRNEEINPRSFTVFDQVEGLYVDSQVTFGDLKGVLAAFVERFFGSQTRLRFRPSFFPFTEPSAEVDIGCFICAGQGCRVCKHTGWLEILGAGMVDPAVLEQVDYDPEKVSGYAFGMGVDRITMLRHGIDDIRLFYENDLRFLQQF
jgi:phenylalanyl-tRNA synthetase alpha chain